MHISNIKYMFPVAFDRYVDILIDGCKDQVFVQDGRLFVRLPGGDEMVWDEKYQGGRWVRINVTRLCSHGKYPGLCPEHSDIR